MNYYSNNNFYIFPKVPGRTKTNRDKKIMLSRLDHLSSYDSIIVFFSGGKDSIACVLHLLEIGVPKDKIELWHHDIDGGSETKMDWNITHSYVQAFAKSMGLQLKYSWRKNGFFGELFRCGPSQPVQFENDCGGIKTVFPQKWKDAEELRDRIEVAELNDDMNALNEAVEELKNMGYRFKFPAKSADLNSRWCSAYLKIMVGDAVLGHLDRTHSHHKLLLVSGERREESSSRAKYNEMEIHKKQALTKQRVVHHWRPVIDYLESDVWDIMKRHGIVPHPVYYAGWNRCSCAMCIFGLPRHWAGYRSVHPERYEQMEELERHLDFTIDNKKDLKTYVGTAIPCTHNASLNDLQMLAANKYDPLDMIVDPLLWKLPMGAYHGAEGGPC